MWNSCNTLAGIICGHSDLVASSILILIHTADGVMTTSGKHIPSVEYLPEVSAGELTFMFSELEERNKNVMLTISVHQICYVPIN